MAGLFDNGLFDEAHSLIKSWKPTKHSREIQYRDDLFAYLTRELRSDNSIFGRGQVHILKEAGRSLADIAINRAVGIELKLNLKSKSEVDRLRGQVEGHAKEYGEGVIIVLCGKTDDSQVAYAKTLFDDFNRQDVLDQRNKRVSIIVKSDGIKPDAIKKPDNLFGLNIPKFDFKI